MKGEAASCSGAGVSDHHEGRGGAVGGFGVLTDYHEPPSFFK